MDPIQPSVDLPQAVIDALDRGAVVVTGNQRAARILRRAFDRRNRKLNLGTWQPAEVMAWDAWVASLWRGLLLEGHVLELLLSRNQELTVWRKIVSSDPETRDTLRSPDSLAELAAEAWLLLSRYNGLRFMPRLSTGFETRTFQRWATEFERRCRNEKWLSSAQLEDHLKAAVASQSLKLRREIALVGFDEMYPSRQGLIESIRSSGQHVEELKIALPVESHMLVRARDEQEEISGAARWARDLLEKSAASRIAIIVPALETRRAAMDRTFRKILAPHLEGVETANHEVPYEFSIGVKLAETALVKTALDLLRWSISPLPLECVSSLLVSPLFAKAEVENNARASFDAFELRKTKLLRPEIKLGWIIDSISGSKRRFYLTNLLAALRAMDRVAKKHSVETALRPHAEWAGLIRDLLEAVRWGHEGAEDSIEFQTRKRWEATLDELATLDFDGSRVTFEHALGSLEWLARLTMFAPESRDAPVQVMGPLEAAGGSFDALWFLGAGDLTWPVRPSANPLLPWGLQAELGIPGVDPAADDERSRHIVERIRGSAETGIFSYALETRAGKQRPASPLDPMHLSVVDIEDVAPKDQKVEPLVLEEFSDSLPIAPVPDSTVQGGADILRLQAACGFRAFAERRLRSTDLKNVELGLDAAERGNIVHRTLEHFWKEVRTQSALKSMSSAEFKDALGQSVEYGLQRAAESSAAEWDSAYVEVQRKRLWNLLVPWFEIELNRNEFAVKLSEKNFEDMRVGPLRLSVRVDRVDTTEDGEVIIDYKTGATKTIDWQSDRPEAPQLPLYAVLSNEAQPEAQLADVAFGRVRVGSEMALDGFLGKVTAEGRKTSSRRVSLPEQVDQWKRVLTDLAKDFHRGDARVDPKKYPLTCNYCAQRILCRLDPAAFDEDIDDEAAIDTWNG
jgi:probable DNA repair protein